MSIRDYFKPANGLPDPSGPLSRDLPSRAIATVNREVQRILARPVATGQVGQVLT